MRLVLSGALEDCRIPDCDTCEAVRSETTTVVTRPLGERESIIETAQRRREKAIAVCVRLWLAWTRAARVGRERAAHAALVTDLSNSADPGSQESKA